MKEVAVLILSSQHPWSGAFYLALGVVLGGLFGFYLTLRSQRPRLIMNGGGSGGNRDGQSWTMSISNRPTFFGELLNGETARDVHALIRLRSRKSQTYQLFWKAHPQDVASVTIEAGQAQKVQAFRWFAGQKGYCIVDQTGQPVARFEERELRFELRLSDRLGRNTVFPITVFYDDTHLKNMPQLRISYRFAIEVRVHRIKNAVQQFFNALRPYN